MFAPQIVKITAGFSVCVLFFACVLHTDI